MIRSLWPQGMLAMMLALAWSSGCFTSPPNVSKLQCTSGAYCPHGYVCVIAKDSAQGSCQRPADGGGGSDVALDGTVAGDALLTPDSSTVLAATDSLNSERSATLDSGNPNDVPLSGTGGVTGDGGGAGMTGTGGVTSLGGSGAASTGGMIGSGGVTASGGLTSTGGVVAHGGTVSSGGIIGSGGTVSSGGIIGSGGTVGSGGEIGAGGNPGSGGVVRTGGTPGSGGISASGGSTSLACSPACGANENCIGGTCVPSTWYGMTCTSQDCPSGATCCNGLSEKCDGIRLPAGDGSNPGEFTVSADGLTVTDTITGLMWQRDSSGTRTGCTGSGNVTCTWAEATAYCAGLTLGGASGWRLPAVMELSTIVDFTVTSVALINQTVFPNTSTANFWASSPYVGASNRAWFVSFYIGYEDTSAEGTYFSVRCVR
jgi:hypothetical protein